MTKEMKTENQALLEVKVKIQKIANLYEKLEIELNKTKNHETFFKVMKIYGEEISKVREEIDSMFPLAF